MQRPSLTCSTSKVRRHILIFQYSISSWKMPVRWALFLGETHFLWMACFFSEPNFQISICYPITQMFNLKVCAPERVFIRFWMNKRSPVLAARNFQTRPEVPGHQSPFSVARSQRVAPEYDMSRFKLNLIAKACLDLLHPGLEVLLKPLKAAFRCKESQ